MTAVEPSACRHCDRPRQDHFQRWSAEAGWHKHTAPTQAQILARMLARRTTPAQPSRTT